MPRVCIIADGRQGMAELMAALAREHLECTLSPSVEALAGPAPDLVVLDADSRAGARALSRIQVRGLHVPTMVVGRLDLLSSLDGQLRGDDFLVRPFDTRELVLRMKRLTRGREASHETETITHGALVIDTARYEVRVAGRPVVLTFKEYELLRFLASNPGRVFTRDVLLDRVWGDDYFGGDRTVDVHVRRLRAKIEAFGQRFIETVRSVGYRFTPASDGGGPAVVGEAGGHRAVCTRNTSPQPAGISRDGTGTLTGTARGTR